MEVPKIKIVENEIVVDTKLVPLIVNDEEVQITLQKVTAGQRREIVKKASTTKIVGSQVQGNVDSMGYQIALLSKAIIEAPFKTDEDSIGKLPTEILDYLFEEYEEWAQVKKKQE